MIPYKKIIIKKKSGEVLEGMSWVNKFILKGERDKSF